MFANNEKNMYLKVVEESTGITVALTFYLLKLIIYPNIVEMLYRKSDLGSILSWIQLNARSHSILINITFLFTGHSKYIYKYYIYLKSKGFSMYLFEIALSLK